MVVFKFKTMVGLIRCPTNNTWSLVVSCPTVYDVPTTLKIQTQNTCHIHFIRYVFHLEILKIIIHNESARG